MEVSSYRYVVSGVLNRVIYANLAYTSHARHRICASIFAHLGENELIRRFLRRQAIFQIDPVVCSLDYVVLFPATKAGPHQNSHLGHNSTQGLQYRPTGQSNRGVTRPQQATTPFISNRTLQKVCEIRADTGLFSFRAARLEMR